MAQDRSITDVLYDILGNVQEIVRSEVRLAKAELRAEAAEAASSGLWIVAGVVGGLSAWIFLLWTAAYALANVMAMWAATLVVALAMGGAAAALLLAGIRKFKRIQPIPARTVETLKENLEWMKGSGR